MLSSSVRLFTDPDECAAAQKVVLSAQAMADLEQAYPAPTGPTPLEII